MCFYFWIDERGIRIDGEERMGEVCVRRWKWGGWSAIKWFTGICFLQWKCMTIKNWKKESVEKSWFFLPEGLAIKRAELVAGAGTLLNWSARLLPAPKFSRLL